MTSNSRTQLGSAAPALALAAATVLLLTACGGTPSAASSAASTTGSTGNRTDSGDGGRVRPGTSGMLAAIDGTTLQVQSADAQTAVTYSAKTAFTDSVAATAADVKVGSCISARAERAQGYTSAPTSPPAGTPETVSQVTISDPVSGSCTPAGGVAGGFGGGPDGERGPGDTFTAPPGAQTDRPTGQPSARLQSGFGGVAFGMVTAVSGSTIAVKMSVPERSSSGTGSPTANGQATEQTRTVQTTATTAYTKTVKATSTALKVGRCVTALGKADSTGTVAATAISIRPAENGSCTMGFVRSGNAAGGTTNG